MQGLALSTRSSYLSGQKKFYDFCAQLGKVHPSGSPCPTDEWTLCLFATFLANTVQHSTIKVYLSAVRSLHIEQGFADPLVECLRLRRVLWGIKRTQGDTSSLRLPVTNDILMVIFHALDLSLPDHGMFWAACNLAYFGFLRSAEFTVPSSPAFRPPSIWGSQMWLLTPVRRRHAYDFGLRLRRQIHFVRAVFCILVGAITHFVQFNLCWHI